MLDLILYDLNPEVCAEWRKATEDIRRVTVYEGGFDALVQDRPIDCLSCAGNSFGRMGAGLDGAIRRKWPEVQRRVERQIERMPWCGEVPVGTSMIVTTGTDEVPYLAYTPSMRSPGTARLDPTNVYLATRAAMMAAYTFRGTMITTLALPGYGGGIGGVEPEQIATQMSRAIRALRDHGI